MMMDGCGTILKTQPQTRNPDDHAIWKPNENLETIRFDASFAKPGTLLIKTLTNKVEKMAGVKLEGGKC